MHGWHGWQFRVAAWHGGGRRTDNLYIRQQGVDERVETHGVGEQVPECSHTGSCEVPCNTGKTIARWRAMHQHPAPTACT